MGIERIGSVGTMSVSNTVKPVKQVDVQPVASSSSANAVRPDIVTPVTTEGKNGYSQSEEFGQDRAGVLSDKEVSPEKVKSAVEDLNKQVRYTQCSFKYHEETNRISIAVIDKETEEVIKEIPPEKALDMIAKAWELAGLMVDERR